MSKKKILFIDDDEIIRKIYVERLEAEGFHVDIAATAGLAQEMLVDSHYDIISVDNILPDMSGPDLVRWIRDKGISVPIIALSALGQDTDIQSMKDAGVNEYIVKDKIVPSDFVKIIKKLL